MFSVTDGTATAAAAECIPVPAAMGAASAAHMPGATAAAPGIGN